MSGTAQLARFTVVAAMNLGVNLGVLALGVEVLELPRQLGPAGLLVAQAAAVFVATSLGYLLHGRFTFTEARRVEGAGRVARYWTVAGGALALQVPLFAVLMALLERGWPGSPALPFIANILGGTLIFVGSFLLNRAWTFQATTRDG